jgi:hypothetical protein
MSLFLTAFTRLASPHLGQYKLNISGPSLSILNTILISVCCPGVKQVSQGEVRSISIFVAAS